MYFPEYLSFRKYIHSQHSEIVAKCMKQINSILFILIHKNSYIRRIFYFLVLILINQKWKKIEYHFYFLLMQIEWAAEITGEVNKFSLDTHYKLLFLRWWDDFTEIDISLIKFSFLSFKRYSERKLCLVRSSTTSFLRKL